MAAGVRVEADAALLHVPDLVGVEQRIGHAAGIGRARPDVLPADQVAHQEHGERPAQALQHRQGVLAHAAEAVVEGEEEGALGQWRAAIQPVDQRVDRHRPVALARQRLHVRGESRRARWRSAPPSRYGPSPTRWYISTGTRSAWLMPASCRPVRQPAIQRQRQQGAGHVAQVAQAEAAARRRVAEQLLRRHQVALPERAVGLAQHLAFGQVLQRRCGQVGDQAGVGADEVPAAPRARPAPGAT